MGLLTVYGTIVSVFLQRVEIDRLKSIHLLHTVHTNWYKNVFLLNAF